MKLDFQYIAEDFSEAVASQNAFFSQKKPGRSEAARAPNAVRGMAGWLVFVSLSLVFFYFMRKNSPGVPNRFHAIAPKPIPTHNLFQTLLTSIAAPLFFTGFIGLLFAQTTRPNRVPFYAPKGTEPPLSNVIWRIAGGIGMIAGIASVIAVFTRPSAPDWRPTSIELAAVLFGPWLAWFILVGFGASWIKRWAKKGQNPSTFATDGCSLRELQSLEVDAGGTTVASTNLSHRCLWPHFVSYLESENLLMLFTCDLTVQIIPKRAFPDGESFERFCGLVQSQIARGQFLPRSSGFPVVHSKPPLPTISVEGDQ